MTWCNFIINFLISATAAGTVFIFFMDRNRNCLDLLKEIVDSLGDVATGLSNQEHSMYGLRNVVIPAMQKEIDTLKDNQKALEKKIEELERLTQASDSNGNG